MKLIIKTLLPKLYLKIRASKNLVFNEHSFLWKSGWIHSIDKLIPVDQLSNPIPWMNYSFVEFFSKRLRIDFQIFEFGSGFSTIYWSKHVNSVTSVEYDRKWYEKMVAQGLKNVKLLFNSEIETGLYSEVAATTGQSYDIIIVDGRDRVNCVRKSIFCLTERGVFILDDSHREKYEPIFNFLAGQGFKNITFSGVKPVSPNFASTTIFYRPNNCLQI